MELTIEQVLQQGVAAHKEGKLEEAERLYRIVLQSQPAHPDANHNLALIAVSVNKVQAALPLFKSALEANPNIEQFWLSYIGALIKEKQFEAAKTVFLEARQKGFVGEQINAIQNQLQQLSVSSKPFDKKKNLTLKEKRQKVSESKQKKKMVQNNTTNNSSPSQSQANKLIELYQNGQYEEAEKLARSFTQQFPEHPFGWKALGLVLKETGSLSESLNSSQKYVQLAPQDYQAHNNLGVSLQALEKFEEAETCYRKTTSLNPDFAEAHSNLGLTLQILDRLEESEISCRKAIALKPDFAQAHYNLAITLKELGRSEEAEASYTRVIALKPNFAEAHYNSGNMFKELDRLQEAEASYTKAIELKPDYIEAYYNLGITHQALGRLDEAEVIFRQAVALKPDYAEAHGNLGVSLKELGRLNEAQTSLRQAIALKPNIAEAHYNLGITLQELGKLEEAETSYREAIALNPTYTKAHDFLLWCLYLLDKKSLFFNELDYLISQDKASAVIGSFTCRSALKYGIEKPNIFCQEPLKYILHVDLNTRYDFKEFFVKKVKSILNENRMLNTKQPLLMKGFQTSGNLFDIQSDFTDKIQKTIRLEIEKYKINFKNSEEGLIKKWPNEYTLYGWLISMKSGGVLQPHIHNQGWLSGSIYINIPPKSEANSGNLVVSLGEEKDAIGTCINVKKIINVVTGSLVLFPASLTHYTIPFESEEDRIVLAFDVKQK